MSRYRRTIPDTARRRARSSIVLLLLVVAVGCSSTGGSDSPSSSSATSGPSASSTGLPWPAAPEQGLPAAATAGMQAEMSRWVEKGFLPGVTAAVVTPAGVWSGAAGVDGAGTELQADTGMSLASITKTMTAALVMRLVERGSVELDVPASTYVDLPQVNNGVTVRQLLGHRSALADPASDAYAGAFTEPDNHWTPQQFLAPVGEAVDAPGTRFSYDNANYVLLGLIAEEAGGVDVATALTDGLWRPLGLTRLAYQDSQRLPPPLARPGEDDQLPDDIGDERYLPFRSWASALAAAGGVAGDAESVARWGYALYGGRLLQPDSVAQMTDFEDGDGYGLGTMDFTHPGRAILHIDGVGHLGEAVGYRTVLAVLPDLRTSIAILTPSTVEIGGYVQWLVRAGSLRG